MLVISVVRKTSEFDKNLVLHSTENHATLNVDEDFSPNFVQIEDINRNSSNDPDNTLVNTATVEVVTDVDSYLDYIDVMRLSKDDIETEIIPMENGPTENWETRLESNEESPLLEMHQSLMDDADLEGFDLNHIINYSHENGFLMSLCELKFGEILPVPVEQIRHNYPHETAKHIKEKVIGLSRRYFHHKW